MRAAQRRPGPAISIAAAFGILLLGGCSASTETQAPLYSGGDVAREVRVAELESEVRALTEQAGAHARAIAGLDRALADVKQERESAAAEAEVARVAASEADRRLAGRLDDLDTRLSELESQLSAIGNRLDALRQASARAMEEAQHARALVNQRAAERAGITLETSEAEARPAQTAQSTEAANSGAGAEAATEHGDSATAQIPTSPREGFAVHLASYKSADAAREGWKDIRRKHAALLDGHAARLKELDLGALGGQYLRLLVGPFPDVAPADAVCTRIRRAGEFCQIAAFAGEPIEDGGSAP